MSFIIRKVLITEAVDPSCANILIGSGITVTTITGLTPEQLIQEIKKYDGLVVRSATKVTSDIIEAADNLKVIGRAGTGVDNIDCDAATRKGILVLNAPGGNAMSAAELTCGMIVSLSRNIPQACASLKSGKWDRKSFMGNELQGKLLGIVGLGRIGREVALRMQSFGMLTVGYDPLVSPEASIEFGVETVDLEVMWSKCDYITVHTPLIPQTKNLINEHVFSKCKPGLKIVNCARGGIVNEDALLKALNNGQCGGAGLDVYMEEPPTNRALIEHPKVICTPHLGASTEEAQIRVAMEIAQQFVDLINGAFVPGIVNSPTFCSSLTDENRPWISLCKSLGKIAGSFFPQGSEINAKLSIYGTKLKQKQKMLGVSALVGILERQLMGESNLINAPILAKDAGIEVTPVFSDDDDPPAEVRPFLSALCLTAISAGVTHSLVATLQEDSALLCAVGGCGFQTAVPLSGKLIFCRGSSSTNLGVKLITELSALGRVSSAFMSTPFYDLMWCIVKVDADVGEVPPNLSSVVDLWFQLEF